MATSDIKHALASASLHDSIPQSDASTAHGKNATNVEVTSGSSASTEALKDITFGSLAGVCGKFIEYPFDTVKVRLQTHTPSPSSPPYRGALDCFVRSYRYDGGLITLYRGISAPLVGAAIETSSLFFSYRLAQETMVRTIPRLRADETIDGRLNLPFSALVVCGAVSGAFTSLLLTPIELVKCRMQVPPLAASLGYKSPGPLSLIVNIFRTEGLRGFWHGQLGTLIRETGGSAAWFGSYEGVCKMFKMHNKVQVEDAKLPIYQQLFAGAAAGVSYNFIFYPADTIKSRMQTQDFSSHPSTLTRAVDGANISSTPLKQTFTATGKALWKDHGIKGFYRGCGITVARAAPSSAFIFAIYEGLRSRFG